MPQMLMITVKYVLIVPHFVIDEIELFIDITSSTFNISIISSGLSGIHWQQTPLMGLVRKHHIDEFP